MAVLLAIVGEGVTFGCLKRRVTHFCMSGAALSGTWMCLIKCQSHFVRQVQYFFQQYS